MGTIFHYTMEGKIITKYNPNYIAYLKRKFSKITEAKIHEHMNNVCVLEKDEFIKKV